MFSAKLRVANDASGFKRIENWLEADPEEVHICMEATGKLWELLAEHFFKLGYQVSVVNPARITAFGKSQLKRTKTDAEDAQVIAEFCQKMEPKPWSPMRPEIRSLRDIRREIDALKKTKTQVQNRLKSGRVDESVTKSLERKIEFLCDEIRELEKLAKKQISEDRQLREDLKLLQTIKGVGWVTAITFLTELPMISGFTSLRQVEAFCGLNPMIRESGKSIRGHSKISKMGNSAIRSALYMASLSAVRHNPNIQALAARLAGKGKKPKVILCAAMRKILRIMVAVYWSRQPFEPSHIPTAA